MPSPIAPPGQLSAFGYHRSGAYYGGIRMTGVTSSGAYSLADNTFMAMPFYTAEPMVVDRIGIYFIGAGSAGCVARVGIYNEDGDRYPAELLVDGGDIAADGATTFVEATISHTLLAGISFFAIAATNVATQPTVEGTGASVLPLLGHTGGGVSNNGGLTHWVATYQHIASTALPSTFTASATATKGNAPLVVVRAV